MHKEGYIRRWAGQTEGPHRSTVTSMLGLHDFFFILAIYSASSPKFTGNLAVVYTSFLPAIH